MSMTVCRLFGLPITAFGAGCAAALVFYLVCAALWCRIIRADSGVWPTLAVLSVPLSWLISRLIYVAVDFLGVFAASSYYLGTLDNPALALRFWDGGYSLMGALLGLIAAALLTERVTRQRERGNLLDAVGFGAPLAILVERGFEHGTGMGIGRAVESEWLIGTGLCPEIDGQFFLPVYLLEALAAFGIFIFLGVWLRKRREHVPGELFRLFLLLFGLTQVLLESLRADEHMIVHFVHVQQVMAILLAVGAMISWTRKALRNRLGGRCVLLWIVTFAAAGAAIVAEFGVDRWGDKLLAYGLMTAALAAIACCAMGIRRAAGRPAAIR